MSDSQLKVKIHGIDTIGSVLAVEITDQRNSVLIGAGAISANDNYNNQQIFTANWSKVITPKAVILPNVSFESTGAVRHLLNYFNSPNFYISEPHWQFLKAQPYLFKPLKASQVHLWEPNKIYKFGTINCKVIGAVDRTGGLLALEFFNQWNRILYIPQWEHLDPNGTMLSMPYRQLSDERKLPTTIITPTTKLTTDTKSFERQFETYRNNQIRRINIGCFLGYPADLAGYINGAISANYKICFANPEVQLLAAELKKQNLVNYKLTDVLPVSTINKRSNFVVVIVSTDDQDTLGSLIELMRQGNSHFKLIAGDLVLIPSQNSVGSSELIYKFTEELATKGVLLDHLHNNRASQEYKIPAIHLAQLFNMIQPTEHFFSHGSAAEILESGYHLSSLIPDYGNYLGNKFNQQQLVILDNQKINNQGSRAANERRLLGQAGLVQIVISRPKLKFRLKDLNIATYGINTDKNKLLIKIKAKIVNVFDDYAEGEELNSEEVSSTIIKEVHTLLKDQVGLVPVINCTLVG